MLAELTKRILERALAEEMTDHLGYESGDPIGHGTGNNRNGTSPKQILTEIGAVDLDIPRDRNATFEPRIVPKGARRLERFNSNIVALYARGLSTRDIRLELKRMYGVDVSPALVSKVTDGILEELTDWQNRPLDKPKTVHKNIHTDRGPLAGAGLTHTKPGFVPWHRSVGLFSGWGIVHRPVGGCDLIGALLLHHHECLRQRRASRVVFPWLMRLAMYARVLGQSRARVMTMVWSAWLSCRSP